MNICDICQCFGKETEEFLKIIKCDILVYYTEIYKHNEAFALYFREIYES